MLFDPNRHHRQSIRLLNFDYSSGGAYFVTICTYQRECFLGEVVDGIMGQNDAGAMVQQIWLSLPERFQCVTDQCVVMPNHFHGVLYLMEGRGEPCVRPCDLRGYTEEKGDHKDRPYGTTPHSLGRIMQAFKSLTTRHYIEGVKQKKWPPFPGKLWQRNYYEHIIRNEKELAEIRCYIENNPHQWELDENNLPRSTEK